MYLYICITIEAGKNDLHSHPGLNKDHLSVIQSVLWTEGRKDAEPSGVFITNKKKLRLFR